MGRVHGRRVREEASARARPIEACTGDVGKGACALETSAEGIGKGSPTLEAREKGAFRRCGGMSLQLVSAGGVGRGRFALEA